MAVSGAIIVELLGNNGDVMDGTVADGTAISAGTLMVWGSDPRTMVASAVADDAIATRRGFAGVLVADKVASDGQVEAGIYTHGVFDMYAGDTATVVGEIVAIDGANIVGPAASADLISGAVVGQALETGAADEQHEILIGIFR